MRLLPSLSSTLMSTTLGWPEATRRSNFRIENYPTNEKSTCKFQRQPSTLIKWQNENPM